jgi:peptidoglycan hydrolase-like protein with peptidoglycan-binding domain
MKVRKRNVHIRSVRSSAPAATIDAQDFDDDEPRRRLPGFIGAGARFLFGAFARHPADAVGVLLIAVASMVICVNALALQRGPHPAPMIRIESPVALTLASLTEKTGTVEAAAPRVATPVPTRAPDRIAAITAQPHDAERPRTQIITDIQRELARKGFYDGNIDGIAGPKMDAAIRDFMHVANLKASGEPSENLLQAVRASSAKAKPRAAAPAAAPVAPATPRPVARAAEAPPAQSPRVLAVQRALGDFGYGPLKRTGQMDGATKTAIEKFERERHLPVTGQVSDRLVRELAAVTGRPLEH